MITHGLPAKQRQRVLKSQANLREMNLNQIEGEFSYYVARREAAIQMDLTGEALIADRLLSYTKILMQFHITEGAEVSDLPRNYQN